MTTDRMLQFISTDKAMPLVVRNVAYRSVKQIAPSITTSLIG